MLEAGDSAVTRENRMTTSGPGGSPRVPVPALNLLVRSPARSMGVMMNGETYGVG